MSNEPASTLWLRVPCTTQEGESIPGIPLVIPKRLTTRLVYDHICNADNDAARNALIRAAWSAGITHTPPDLAGRRSQYRLRVPEVRGVSEPATPQGGAS
jgi:hypothetical protein